MRVRTVSRFYFERALFTTRGRFAMIIAMLMSVYGRSAVPASESTSVIASLFRMETQPTVQAQLVETATQVLGGGLLVAITVLGGMCVLVALDIYEAEVGTIVDVED